MQYFAGPFILLIHLLMACHWVREDFLQYLWEQQCFDSSACRTTAGASLTILSPGIRNHREGPDFLDASLHLDGILWRGSVEVHVQASGWEQHSHHRSDLYEGVILHVVWEADKEVRWRDGQPIPTFELKPRLAEPLLLLYKQWMASSSTIPCGKQSLQVAKPVREAMLEEALFLRLQVRYHAMTERLERHHGEIAGAAYELLARGFGFGTNGPAFSQLAQRVAWPLVRRHRLQILHLEALLFGQAGFLPEVPAAEGYVQELQAVYHSLAERYQLGPGLPRTLWRCYSLRPPSFPCVRIAQLASLLHAHEDLFHLFLHTPLAGLRQALARSPSPYWRSHYDFDKPRKRASHTLGRQGQAHILINVAVPLLVTYGRLHADKGATRKAVELLSQLPAEENRITRLWQGLGWQLTSALHSQGALSLYEQFCKKKACLSCAIGKQLLEEEEAAWHSSR